MDYIADDIYGVDAGFDYTSDSTCVQGPQIYTKHTIEDGGAGGYYEPHTLYYIVHQGRVIFAATSEYGDQSYGSVHGTPGARERWQEKFRSLSGRRN